MPGSPPNMVNIDQFLFGNAGKTHRFILNSNALTLQTTRYGRFEDFSAKFLSALEMVHDIAQLDFTDLVGLRYFDYVAPRSNDRIEQYVVPGVRGSNAPFNGKVTYSFSETFSQVDHVRLRSRVLIQDGPLVLPLDTMSDGLDVDQRFLGRSGWHATLDTDGFVDRRIEFSTDAVRENLRVIHSAISAAFKSVVTDHALKIWNE